MFERLRARLALAFKTLWSLGLANTFEKSKCLGLVKRNACLVFFNLSIRPFLPLEKEKEKSDTQLTRSCKGSQHWSKADGKRVRSLNPPALSHDRTIKLRPLPSLLVCKIDSSCRISIKSGPFRVVLIGRLLVYIPLRWVLETRSKGKPWKT